MTTRCLDEATLQAYMDGELARERAAAAAAHLSACEACSAALAEVEGEANIFAAAFAPDETVPVPTEALRARVNAAVARLEDVQQSSQQPSRVRPSGGLFASLSGLFNFTPQRAAALASVFVAVVSGVVYFSTQKSEERPARTRPATEVAVVNPTTPAPAALPKPAESPEVRAADTAAVNVKLTPRRKAGGSAGVKTRAATPAPKVVALPGEHEYQTAIASLEKTIKLGGDVSLRPTVRAEYERNLALLDSAIEQTRQVAARDPRDKDAVGFLMAAYQSKVELLTRVADQAQVATLGR